MDSEEEPITLEEIEDAEKMAFGAALEFEPPSVRLVKSGKTYHTEAKPGWIKLGVGFRAVMKDLRGPPLAVFIAICLHINQEGKAWPGVRALASLTGYNKDTVTSALAVLESIPGLLEVAHRRGPKGTNIYTPAFAAYGKANPQRPKDSDTKEISASGNHAQTPDAEIPSVRAKGAQRPNGRRSASEPESDRSRRKKNPEVEVNAPAAAVFSAYENNIALITPMMAEIIKDALSEYPADWIVEAIRESVKATKRSWPYVEAILKRWKRDGFKAVKVPDSPSGITYYE